MTVEDQTSPMVEKPSINLSHVTDTVNGSVISFHKVNYDVEVKIPGKCYGSTTKKVLMDINGVFKPGMNAILGPTGSGKSSLLDIIAGRKDPRGLKGTLLLDGNPQPKNYKCMCGYVVQDDIIMGTLTVKENIMFSANLRLPGSISQAEKQLRVEETIGVLNLEKCADSKVGNEYIRGVSGGERKRTSIGMELIISQSVLFLDEPTTGLDASTASTVMSLLKRLSLAGRTIVFSIHQPRYSIFRLFDTLMLLSQGHTVYHGPSSEALDFFSYLGYECEAHNNPPDFFLDVILGEIPCTKPSPNSHTSAIEATEPEVEEEADIKNHLDVKIELGGRRSSLTEAMAVSLELEEKYRGSKWCQEVLDELDVIYKEYEKRKQNGDVVRVVGEYATSFPSQVATLAGRAVKNIVRNPLSSLTQTFILCIMGTLVGTLYFQLGMDLADLQNRQGAFFFITMNMVFSNISAVAIFISERAIFIHENVSGFYRVSSFFIAKVFSDLVPLRLLPVTIYAFLTYFMAGFRLEVGKFFIYYISLFIITMTAASVAFFASCVCGIFSVANLLTILILVFMLVFGGLFVNLRTMPAAINWVQYFSVFRYALKIFYINELHGMEFCRDVSVNGTMVEKCLTGDDYLDEQGIRYDSPWNLWQNHLAITALCLFFMTMAYTLLRKMKKLK